MKNGKNRQFLEASYGLPVCYGGCSYEEDILDNVIVDENEIIEIIKNELRRASELLNTDENMVSLVYDLSIFAETSDVRYSEIDNTYKYIFNIDPTILPNVVSLRLVQEGYILNAGNGNVALSETVGFEKPIIVNYTSLKKAISKLKLETIEPDFNQVVSAVSEGDSFNVRIGSKKTNKFVRTRTNTLATGRISR